MKRKTTNLGLFTVTGDLVVSDPCYDYGTWCATVLKDVLPGEWQAKVIKQISVERDDNGRIMELVAVHSEHGANQKWVKLSEEIGVDSGQCGLFDASKYKRNYEQPYPLVGHLASYRHDWLFSQQRELAQRTKDLRKMTDEKLRLWSKEQMKQLRKNIKAVKANTFPWSKTVPDTTTDWYKICCDITKLDLSAGLVDGGVVSETGYGDGSYALYVAYDKHHNVIGARIKFI